MVGLIILGLFVAFAFGAIVAGVSALLAWLAHRIFPMAYEPDLAAWTSALLPVGLLAWTLADFVSAGDCCETGPQSQALLILMMVHGILLFAVWPIGYRINLSLIRHCRA